MRFRFLLLLWLIVAASCSATRESGVLRSTPSTASISSTSSTLSAAPPTAAEERVSTQVAELVRRVQGRVSEIRGLPSRQPVVYKPLAPAQLRKVLQDSIDEQVPPRVRPAAEFSLRRLGLLGKNQSLDEIFVSLYSEQVAGLYDEEAKRLYIVTSFNLRTSVAEIILAHEICHALQDQNFNLSKWPLKEIHNDDEAYAALSVLEGDATILMTDYGQVYIKPGRILADLPGMMMMMGGGQPQLENAPYFLQQVMIFPYIFGVNFVQEAIDRDERGRIFRSRPRSTEQILHPEKYFAPRPDEPVRLSLDAIDRAAPKGWERRYHNVMGEMGARIFLQANFEPTAERDAAGWGGDIYALYGPKQDAGDSAPATTAPGASPPTEYALLWKTRWDTPGDAAEFDQAMQYVMRNRLFESQPATEPDGALRSEANGAVALLKRSGLDVVYVDASSLAIARRFLAAALKPER